VLGKMGNTTVSVFTVGSSPYGTAAAWVKLLVTGF